MWRLAVRNIFRNKRRTLLTLSSVAVLLFLLSALAVAYRVLGRPLQGPGSHVRLFVRNATALSILLPLSYLREIQRVPGVAACTPASWLGAYFRDPGNTFASFAVGVDSIFDVYTDAQLPAQQLASFQADRTGAVVGRRLAEKFGWSLGDRITLLGSFYGIEPELTLRGIYRGGDENMLFMSWDYFNDLLGRPNETEGYWVRAARPELVPRVAQAIDALFRDLPLRTRTETEGETMLTMISWLGNVRALILFIGGATAFAILMIIANAMALSTRERIPEAGIMRALGFRKWQVLRLFVTEALCLTLLGGLIGLVAAKLFFLSLEGRNLGGLIWADFRIRPDTALICLGIALVLGLLASAGPAYRAARLNIARALRYTG